MYSLYVRIDVEYQWTMNRDVSYRLAEGADHSTSFSTLGSLPKDGCMVQSVAAPLVLPDLTDQGI